MNIKEIYKKNRGIILFFVAMFAADIIWKLSVHGEETINDVQIFGFIDASGFFDHISAITAAITYFFTHIIRPNAIYMEQVVIGYSDSLGAIEIVWGCSGVKQAFIFICIMLLAEGSWKKKAWFIPLGIAICFIYNIMRLVALALIVENHRELFDLFHNYILKYIFYGVIFLMWVWWEEVIRKPKKHKEIGVK